MKLRRRRSFGQVLILEVFVSEDLDGHKAVALQVEALVDVTITALPDFLDDFVTF